MGLMDNDMDMQSVENRFKGRKGMAREHIHILGPMGSGKTTVARGIKAQLETQGHAVWIISDKNQTSFENFDGVIIWDDIDPPKGVVRKCIHITNGA